MSKPNRILDIIPYSKPLPAKPLTINTKTEEPLKIKVYSPIGQVIKSIVSTPRSSKVSPVKLATCPSGHTSLRCSLACKESSRDSSRLCQDCWLHKCITELKADLCGYCYKSLKTGDSASAAALEWNPMRYHSKCWQTIVELTRH